MATDRVFVKSICYQTLPFVFDKMSRKCAAGGSVVVVVSPLISLMEDQAASLRKRGVNAAIVTSGGGVSNEFCAIDDDLGKYSHLFCAPEALISSRWREALVVNILRHTPNHVTTQTQALFSSPSRAWERG